MPETLSEFVGFFGVLLYLGSYFALQAGFIRGQTFTYAGLNLAAASCVLYDLQANFNLPSILIQMSWIAISLFGISRLIFHASYFGFTPDEVQLLESKLPGVPRASARRFLASGTWVDADTGTELAREDVPVNNLVYLLRGSALVSQNGHPLASCPGDSFIGELTALDALPATATVTLEQPSRYFSIDASDLRRLSDRDPELNRALHMSFTADARRKLVAANERQRRFELGIPAQ